MLIPPIVTLTDSQIQFVDDVISKVPHAVQHEIVRVKKSCPRCEKIVQQPAPSRPIPRSMAGPSLLAFILVSKFDDHVPLYRLNEIFARMGADIPDTTMVDWCGGAMKTLAPLLEKIETAIMASDVLHVDDTPIRVLDRSRRDKGLGKGVKKGRIWAYVRDQRPWAGTAPPGAERQLTRIPGKGDLAKAFRYGLSRWTSFTLFLDDGRVAIDNNAAERALRPIGVGRRNWLFAGSDAGGETLARAMTIIHPTHGAAFSRTS